MEGGRVGARARVGARDVVDARGGFRVFLWAHTYPAATQP